MKRTEKTRSFPNIEFSTEWDHGDGRAGVQVSPNGLIWWYRPNGPGGSFGEVGAQQTFEEFVVQGALGVPVPEDVMRELGEVLSANGVGIPRLKTAAEILNQKNRKTDPASIEERKEIERYIDWFKKNGIESME